MQFLFVARDFHSYTNRRLIECAHEMGHEPFLCEPHRIVVYGRALYWHGRRLPEFATALVKTTIDSPGRDYALSISRSLESRGIKVVNSSLSVERACNKYYTYQVLEAAGIPAVPTLLAGSADDVDLAIDLLGGCPVMVKFLYGTHGTGIVQAVSRAMAKSLFVSYHALGVNVCIQPYLNESKGETVRLLMAGGKTLATVRMIPEEGSWCSNYHRGGAIVVMERDECLSTLAAQTMTALGLHYGGIDVIFTQEGPQVLEANSSPGLEGVEKISGLDIAAGIVQSLVE